MSGKTEISLWEGPRFQLRKMGKRAVGAVSQVEPRSVRLQDPHWTALSWSSETKAIFTLIVTGILPIVPVYL